MIQCQVCNQELNHFVTHGHLRLHGMTTAEYKLKFPNADICDQEYRDKMRSSAIALGLIPPRRTEYKRGYKLHFKSEETHRAKWSIKLGMNTSPHKE